jgi:hypothetical protein
MFFRIYPFIGLFKNKTDLDLFQDCCKLVDNIVVNIASVLQSVQIVQIIKIDIFFSIFDIDKID